MVASSDRARGAAGAGATVVDARMAVAVRSLARLARIVEQTGRSAGISLAQYRLLLFAAREPQRAGELATRAAVSKPTLTNLVKALERDGFIRRVPLADDRRGVRLEVTAAGDDALAEAERTLSARVGLLLGDVDDVEQVLDAFVTLDAALDREVDRFLSRMEDERADG